MPIPNPLYGPPARPFEADPLPHSHAVKITPADLKPPNVTHVKAHEPAERRFPTWWTLPAPDFVEEPILYEYKTYVQAHSPSLPYPISFGFVAATDPIVITPYEYKTYVRAHDPIQKLLDTRAYIQRLLDLKPPSVAKITAHDIRQRYGAYYYPPLAYADRKPPYTTFVKAHEHADRYKVSYGFPLYTELKPPDVYYVKAHNIEHGYGSKAVYPPFTVVVNFYTPSSTYVKAHDPEQKLLGTRYQIQRLLDLQPPSVQKVSAHDIVQRFGAYYYVQRLFDLKPPSVTSIEAFDLPQKLLDSRFYPPLAYADRQPPYATYVKAHDPEQRYGAKYYVQRLFDLAPPSVQRIIAHDIEQHYGAKYFEIPFPQIVSFYTPYSTYVKAHDPEQKLLSSRAYIQRLLDLAPPETTKVAAFEYEQRYGAYHYVQRLLDFAPPEVHYVKAFDLDQFLLDTRQYLPFPDRQPPQVIEVKEFTLPQFELGPRTYHPPFIPLPPITSRVTAFDLPQQLLGTRAYIQRLLDLQPPEVTKIDAHTFDYKYGAKQTGIILPEIVNYYPPYSTYVEAHDPEQFLLGSRFEYPPFADRKPTFGKGTAFTLPEKMLGTRAYVQRLFDLKPPSVTQTEAFSYDRPYGARQSGITLPEFINFYTPFSTYVRAHDPEHILLGSRSELPFADRQPPDVYMVKAFDLEQLLLGTRYELPFADRKPPSITTVEAFDLPQKPNLPRFVVVTPDRKPPETTFVLAHDPIHKLLGSRFFLPSAFIIVTYGTPYESLTSISATASEAYEALFGTTSSWIDPYEALQGVASTWQDPYEALQRISTAINNPYESAGTGILSVYEIPWEAITTLSALLAEPYESAQGISSTKIAPYEALQGASSTYSTPWETIAVLSSLKTLPYESVQHIANTVSAVYESLQGVTAQKQYPWEANLGVISTYTEWYEARGQVTNNLILPYESLQQITKTFADQPFEVLLGLALTGQLPWEAASTIVPQHMFEAVLYAHWYVRTMKHLEARIFTRYATEPKQGRRYPNP